LQGRRDGVLRTAGRQAEGNTEKGYSRRKGDDERWKLGNRDADAV